MVTSSRQSTEDLDFHRRLWWFVSLAVPSGLLPRGTLSESCWYSSHRLPGVHVHISAHSLSDSSLLSLQRRGFLRCPCEVWVRIVLLVSCSLLCAEMASLRTGSVLRLPRGTLLDSGFSGFFWFSRFSRFSGFSGGFAVFAVFNFTFSGFSGFSRFSGFSERKWRSDHHQHCEREGERERDRQGGWRKPPSPQSESEGKSRHHHTRERE